MKIGSLPHVSSAFIGALNFSGYYRFFLIPRVCQSFSLFKMLSKIQYGIPIINVFARCYGRRLLSVTSCRRHVCFHCLSTSKVDLSYCCEKKNYDVSIMKTSGEMVKKYVDWCATLIKAMPTNFT